MLAVRQILEKVPGCHGPGDSTTCAWGEAVAGMPLTPCLRVARTQADSACTLPPSVSASWSCGPSFRTFQHYRHLHLYQAHAHPQGQSPGVASPGALEHTRIALREPRCVYLSCAVSLRLDPPAAEELAQARSEQAQGQRRNGMDTPGAGGVGGANGVGMGRGGQEGAQAPGSAASCAVCRLRSPSSAVLLGNLLSTLLQVPDGFATRQMPRPLLLPPSMSQPVNHRVVVTRAALAVETYSVHPCR